MPVEGSLLAQVAGRLFIKSVHGQNVASQPTGNLINPDVVFSAAGDISVVVEALNIPNGTPVTLTINHTTTGVTQLPATGQETLQNGLATFTTTVAAGTGTLQAFATYTVGQAPPAP